MTEGESKVPAKIDREGLFAVQILKDSFFLAVGATTATAIALGTSVGGALLQGLVASVAIFFVALIVQAIFNASRETLLRKVLGWMTVSGLLTAVYHAWIGDAALYLGGGALALTLVHTLLLHRRQDAEYRSEAAEKAGNRALAERLAREALPESTTPPLSRVVDAAVNALPSELEPTIRELVNRAVEDFTHLQELLADPQLDAYLGHDDDAILFEAEAVLVDLLRRAPVVSRVVALARRRSDDDRGKAAAEAAEGRLRQQAQALHEAASAALQLAASDQAQALADLREHVDRLNAVREARDELEGELAKPLHAP